MIDGNWLKRWVMVILCQAGVFATGDGLAEENNVGPWYLYVEEAGSKIVANLLLILLFLPHRTSLLLYFTLSF